MTSREVTVLDIKEIQRLCLARVQKKQSQHLGLDVKTVRWYRGRDRGWRVGVAARRPLARVVPSSTLLGARRTQRVQLERLEEFRDAEAHVRGHTVHEVRLVQRRIAEDECALARGRRVSQFEVCGAAARKNQHRDIGCGESAHV